MINLVRNKVIKFLVVQCTSRRYSPSGCVNTTLQYFILAPCLLSVVTGGGHIVWAGSSITKPLHSGHIYQAVISGGLMPYFHVILL